MPKAQGGFSLIELLIVVAVNLAILAIAIPNFTRSMRSANEASAAGMIRLVATCLTSFTALHPSGSFPDAIAAVGPAGSKCIDQGTVDAASGTPRRGYEYIYLPTRIIGTSARGFNLMAVPAQCNRTGVRTYFVDETGVLRFTSDSASCPPADVNSAPIN